MVTIVRDRIQDMIKKGVTLDQVKAARPSLDYDGRYGPCERVIEAAWRGPQQTEMIIEAVTGEDVHRQEVMSMNRAITAIATLLLGAAHGLGARRPAADLPTARRKPRRRST